MPSERIQRRIDRLLEEADEAIAQRNWALVRDSAQAALSLDPENSEAQAYMAAAERNLAAAAADAQAEGAASAIPVSTPPTSAPQPADVLPASPSTELRTSFVNGRYQVKRFLGEGGKKKVYLAHDTLLDRDVAFALIKTEGLDDTGRQRIRREAQAMARLGSHPNIVSVFDLGEEEGQPYMVTEFMAGGDVEGLIEKAPDHKLSLEQTIEIAKQASRGLEFAHSKGLIHRDVKPGNVWLNEHGVAKIGDFGLAVALDRSRLTQAGMMVGTVSYMPPESALGGGGQPEAPSDLYSLGAMLYEMVAGRPPFVGDDTIAVISQHINTPPVAPSWHNPRCPKPLESLILRLLSKAPAERPQSAAEFLEALDAIDVSSPLPVGEGQGEGAANPLDRLAQGTFVGRAQEMAAGRQAVEDAFSGRVNFLLVTGELGVGKTRLAEETGTYASLRGALALWGASYPDQGAPPYWPWVQALRGYVRGRDPGQLRSELGSAGPEVAKIVSELRERLPDLPQPAPVDPAQERFRLFDSVAAFLRNASANQPLVIVLDNVHFADQPTLLLAQFLLQEAVDARVLIIGTYREVEQGRRHPVAQVLAQLAQERRFRRLPLRGLSREETGRMMEAITGAAPTPALLERVHGTTEGVPLFVEEVVRFLTEEGKLAEDSRRGEATSALAIPQTVREVIGQRLDRLSSEASEVLTIAAIVGREFDLAALREVTGRDEDSLLELLEGLVAARVIEETPGAVARYQFGHGLTRQVLTAELTTTRRVRLHARIAQALERAYGDAAEAHAPELAYHFAEAQTVLGPEPLVRYSLLAGERALAGYAYEEALPHFQQGLEAKGVPSASLRTDQAAHGSTGSPRAATLTAGPGGAVLPLPLGPVVSSVEPEGRGEGSLDAEAAALLSGLGRCQTALGQYQEGMANMNRAFDYYEAAGDAERAVELASHPVVALQGRLPERPHLVRRALALAPPDSLAAGRLLSEQVRPLAIEEGKYQEALESSQRALAIAQRHGDRLLEARTLAVTASVHGYYRDWNEDKAVGLRAIALAQSIDDPWAEALARYWTATAFLNTGDGQEARRLAGPAVAAGERARDHWLLNLAFVCNASVHAAQGEWGAAREFNDRAQLLGLGAPGPRMVWEYQTGDFSQGERYLERIIALASAPRATLVDKGTAGSALATAAYITGNTSRLGEAESLARPALAWHVPGAVLGARATLALIAVMRGDAAAAEEGYAALQPLRGGFAGVSGFTITAGDHLLGLLSVSMGRLDRAAAHFEDALAFSRRGGFRPLLAWTCHDYAAALLDHPSTSSGRADRPKAMALLDEALAISRELGMRPLMERVLSRRELLGA